MTTDPSELTKTLEAELCQAFAITPIDRHRWVVHTPLLYDDGDALPVILTRTSSGWVISDDGMTASHLTFDDFEPTEARLERLRTVVLNAGAELDGNWAVRLILDEGTPSPYDIGDFVQVVAQVRGAAVATTAERDQSRWYTTRIRHNVIARLRDPDYEENWAPQMPNAAPLRATYRADLRLSAGTSKQPVALFVASTSDKTNVAALTAGHFGRAQIDVQPLLAYHPGRVPSPAVLRFQDEVNDDNAVVPAAPDELSQLFPALRRYGVDIVE